MLYCCFVNKNKYIPLTKGEEFQNLTRTNAQDVKAESMVDRLVDQLVRHAVKAHMTSQGNRTSTLTLKRREI